MDKKNSKNDKLYINKNFEEDDDINLLSDNDDTDDDCYNILDLTKEKEEYRINLDSSDEEEDDDINLLSDNDDDDDDCYNILDLTKEKEENGINLNSSDEEEDDDINLLSDDDDDDDYNILDLTKEKKENGINLDSSDEEEDDDINLLSDDDDDDDYNILDLTKEKKENGINLDSSDEEEDDDINLLSDDDDDDDYNILDLTKEKKENGINLDSSDEEDESKNNNYSNTINLNNEVNNNEKQDNNHNEEQNNDYNSYINHNNSVIFSEMPEKPIEKFRNDIGNINVLVVGDSNVGKTTLIKAMFNGDLSESNKNIIDENIVEITNEKKSASFIDTKGFLQFEKYKELIENRKYDTSKRIRVAWVCKEESNQQNLNTIYENEINLINMLLEYMPVIFVITKLSFDTGLKNKIKNLFSEINVIRVQSIYVNVNDYEIKPFNLVELVNLTNNVANIKVKSILIESRQNSSSSSTLQKHKSLPSVNVPSFEVNNDRYKHSMTVRNRSILSMLSTSNSSLSLNEDFEFLDIIKKAIESYQEENQITDEIQEISKEGIPISILYVDCSKYGDSKQKIKELDELVKNFKTGTDKSKTIHIAWVCIEGGSIYLEEEDEELIKMLLKNMPTVALITKLSGDANLQSSIRRSFNFSVNVILVQATSNRNTGKLEFKPKILEKLIKTTYDEVADREIGGLDALITCQKVNLELKMNRANFIIKSYENIIKKSKDYESVIDNMIGMITKISVVFGLYDMLINNIIMFLFGDNRYELTKRFKAILYKYTDTSTKEDYYLVIKNIGEMYLQVLQNLYKRNNDILNEAEIKECINNEINSNYPNMNVISNNPSSSKSLKIRSFLPSFIKKSGKK
eukprot:jgi/Orpsp1_1/1187225/evm.model.d7180000056185.1